MLHLITGTPGSGKTLYAVSLIMDYHKQNLALLEKGLEPRTIYADIDGLDIEGVEPAPDDWRDTPDGSIVFYDEIQQRDAFKKAKLENDIVNALQVHRHTGHDVYGITQFPILLHANFNAVVGIHWHLHRGWGLSAATVYQWAYSVTAPNTPSNKKLAENSFRFNYPKSLFDYYKSATVHTHKARIPKKFFLIILFILFGVFFVYKVLYNSDNFIMNKVTGKAPEALKAPESVAPVAPVASVASVPPLPVSANNLPPVAPPSASVPVGFFNPLDGSYIPDINLVPNSVVGFGGRCSVYNKDGALLSHISYDDCQLYLHEKGLLPKIGTNNTSAIGALS